MQQIDILASTNGTGLWADGAIKQVRIIGFTVRTRSDGSECHELRAHFAPDTWSTDADGLVYTDRGWLDEFNKACDALGFTEGTCDFSEQGMQGDDYVSLDIDNILYAALVAKYGHKALEIDDEDRPAATCVAHEMIIRAWSYGLETDDGYADPLPAECAQRLAKLTENQAYKVLDGDHEFGPGEGIDDDGLVEGAEVLRRVEVSNVRDTYRICRKGRVLCVVFIQHDPTGHAVWSRIDIAPV